MPAFDRLLDTGDQQKAALFGQPQPWSEAQLPFVKRDGESVVAQRRGALDQLRRGVRNPIQRIVGGVCMELDFQHATRLLKLLAGYSAPDAQLNRVGED